MTAVAVTVRVLGALGRLGSPLSERVADMPRHRAAGAVEAAVFDPLPELGDRGALGVVLHRCRLRDRVRGDRENARPTREHTLDDSLLGGVVEVSDVENRRLTHH